MLPNLVRIALQLGYQTWRPQEADTLAKKATSKTGCGCGTVIAIAIGLGIIVGAVSMMSNGSSPTTTQPVNRATTTTPATTVAIDGTVLATWELKIGDLTITESLVYNRGTMIVAAVSSEESDWVMEVLERPTDKLGKRRFDLQPGDPRSEYLVLSSDGTVRYFSWEGRQFAYSRATFIAADAMTIGFDPAAMACVPKDLSVVSEEIIGLYEQLQEFKNETEFARVGFAIGGPYNHWLTTFDTLQEDFHESLEQLGFLAGDVRMLGMDYVSENQEGIVYFERLIEAGIALATCEETPTTRPEVTSTTTTTAAVPPNPGNTVNCADFDTWEEAQTWYDTYAPHYGDIALIDTNNNGVACEKLLP